jgi:hypothetical protein
MNMANGAFSGFAAVGNTPGYIAGDAPFGATVDPLGVGPNSVFNSQPHLLSGGTLWSEPAVHPAMSRVPAGSEPKGLGRATGRGAEPIV